MKPSILSPSAVSQTRPRLEGFGPVPGVWAEDGSSRDAPMHITGSKGSFGDAEGGHTSNPRLLTSVTQVDSQSLQE